MSDRFKFRAWSKHAKKMFTDVDDVCMPAVYADGSFRLEYDGVDVTGDLILMQCTGLRDKDGALIFEGDVVERLAPDARSHEYTTWEENENYDEGVDEALEIAIPRIIACRDVVTMSRFPVFWLEHEGFGYEGDDLERPDEFTVIGNIHANPELMEAE